MTSKNSSFSFDIGDYDEDIDLQKPMAKKATQTDVDKNAFSFDIKDYEEKSISEEEKPYFGQYSHLTPSQFEVLSPEKKKELQEYSPLKGVAKGFLKGLSFGGSERVPELKVQEHETGAGVGEFLGAALPIHRVYKAIELPLKAIGGLMGFGRLGMGALKTGTALATGAVSGAAKQQTAGEGFDIGEISTEAAMFGALDGIFRGVPAGYNWLKSLKPAQQSEILVKGILPENLTPNQYKFYETEIAPELQKVAREEYQNALEKAVMENENTYRQELANVKAAHEEDLFKRSQKNELSDQEYARAQQDYQNKLKQVGAEHENKVLEIKKQNDEALEQFEVDKKEFDTMKSRQRAVQQAIQPKQENIISLEGRVSPQGEDVGFRPAPSVEANPTLENRIGNSISPNEITNTTNAGRANMEAVRANDAIDYRAVNEAYTLSEQLNAEVSAIQPGLVQDLMTTANQIRMIPEASPPQKQLLGVIEKTLEQLAVLDEAGNVTGFLPINNRVLQEQAKSLRYFMDFNFEHGNTRGIFSPTVRNLENAIEFGADSVGNQAAIDANQNARNLYRQWAQDYDNPYIRPYRDVGNFDYSKTFKGSLDVDEFNMLNRILSRSNAGQQLSGSTRRALVEKQLSKFTQNPRKVDPIEFNKTLRELRAVISPEEEQVIRQQFNQARRTPVIVAKKIKSIEPIESKLKKEPTSVEIPLSKAKKQIITAISKVKIPLKPELKATPEMRAAGKKMNITPEEAMKMSDTPSGLKEMKKDFSKTDAGNKLYNKIGKQKVKDILYEGNVERKFTGGELYKIINKGDNYAIISEILGEDAAADLLVTSKQIGEKKATIDTMKKYGMKVGSIKALLLFGIL